MGDRLRGKIVLAALLIIAAAVFGAGINWGLPSKSVDSYFFSADSKVRTDSRQAYLLSGAGISRLAPNDQKLDRSKPITLIDNQTPMDPADAAGRARILRNFRLNTFQPEERLTLDALVRLHPYKGEFDPGIYRFGGLWYYPLWGIARIASGMNLVKLSSDIDYYLDQPQEAGRIYLLARAYSAAWGLLAMAAVFALVHKLTQSLPAAAVAALAFLTLPSVLTAAHQATPHLAGAALLLMALLAATNYVESTKAHWMLLAAAACGMAAAMSPAAIFGVLLIPLMAMARGAGSARLLFDFVAGFIIAIFIYVASNPMVLDHMATGAQRQAIGLTLENFRKLYPVGPVRDSAIGLCRQTAAALSIPLAIAGLLGLLVLPRSFQTTEKDWREEYSQASVEQSRVSDEAGLLWAICVLSMLAFAIFAANRFFDYALDGIFPQTLLVVCAFLALERFIRRGWLVFFLGLALVVAGGLYGWSYERGFMLAATDSNSRTQAATELQMLLDAKRVGPRPTLAVAADPVPYSMPPVNLFAWRILLLPNDPKAIPPLAGDTLVSLAGENDIWNRFATPLSTANRRIVYMQVGQPSTSNSPATTR